VQILLHHDAQLPVYAKTNAKAGGIALEMNIRSATGDSLFNPMVQGLAGRGVV
jgi:hypothetical protein